MVFFAREKLRRRKKQKMCIMKDIMNTSDSQIRTYADRLQKMIRCRMVSVKGNYDNTEFVTLRDVVKAKGKIWGRGTVDTKTPLFAT